MSESVGAHLLGRMPSIPDERDYDLGLFVGDETPLRAALRHLRNSWAVTPAVKTWAKLATAAIEANGPTPPAPSPAPTPQGDVVWTDGETVLDQADTGHCVGFGGAQWGNTLPVDDHLGNDDGHKLYYECKVEDGEASQENGSTVRSLANVLRARGRLKTYAFASTVDDVVQFLDTKGPVIFGTDWTDDMFNPAPDGLVRPTGNVAGGHCYLAVGHLASAGRIRCLNSWGDGWGKKGMFEMSIMDAAQLLSQDGEACAAVELP